MLNRLTELREKRDRGEGGFTLIELLVVVVIIGILIAIAIPLYLNYKKGATDKSTQSDVRAALSAMEQCMSDNSLYPSAYATGSGQATFTGCAQVVKLSSGTTFKYFPKSDNTQYLVLAYNGSGNVDGTSGGGFYCYASKTGGSVTKDTATQPTAYADNCP